MSIVAVYRKGTPEHVLTNNMVSEVEVWHVTTDGSSTRAEVRDAAGLPVYYARHPDNSNLYVASKRVRQVGGTSRHFEVEVEYAGDLYGAPWPEQIQEIITRDPDVEWTTEETVESVDTDIYGRKIQNAVFEDIDPPLTDTRSYTSLVISRNELIDEYSAVKGRAFANHVNANTFYGAPPKSVLCKRISARRQTKSNFAYWRVTYVFWFKDAWLPGVDLYTQAATEAPWGARVANMGRRQPKPTTVAGRFTYEPIKDANGDPVTSPVPIGLDGLPISQQQGASTVWLIWELKQVADFSILGL